jgi:hypothetical protein
LNEGFSDNQRHGLGRVRRSTDSRIVATIASMTVGRVAGLRRRHACATDNLLVAHRNRLDLRAAEVDAGGQAHSFARGARPLLPTQMEWLSGSAAMLPAHM